MAAPDEIVLFNPRASALSAPSSMVESTPMPTAVLGRTSLPVPTEEPTLANAIGALASSVTPRTPANKPREDFSTIFLSGSAVDLEVLFVWPFANSDDTIHCCREWHQTTRYILFILSISK
nr:hypothetical protein [Pluralibacter gergoviae]